MAKPIIKWVGGKHQLLDYLKELIPTQINTYYEPFIGGGAMLFDLKPQHAIINDINSQLINLYKQIQLNINAVILYLDKYQNEYNTLIDMNDKSIYYYTKRTRYNSLIESNILNDECAALFIFLNKTCFNGLYRVNSLGKFNASFNFAKTINLYNFNNINEISTILKNCNIMNDDFEIACTSAKQGDFVFFDSPYAETFDTYQSNGFSKDDHIRLSNLFKKLSDKHVKCVLTNNDCQFIRDLYKDFSINSIDVKKLINCKGSKRLGHDIIITN